MAASLAGNVERHFGHHLTVIKKKLIFSTKGNDHDHDRYVNQEEWAVRFSVVACINIFYNNEQRITRPICQERLN